MEQKGNGEFMKRAIYYFFLYLSILSSGVFAQAKETFDIATFQPPKDWQRQATAESIQFLTEDKKTGAFCIVTLIKSMPSLGDPKENFNAAWGTIVKEAVSVSTPPTMQPSNTVDGWTEETGSASFEKDGLKGAVVLITTTPPPADRRTSLRSRFRRRCRRRGL